MKTSQVASTETEFQVTELRSNFVYEFTIYSVKDGKQSMVRSTRVQTLIKPVIGKCCILELLKVNLTIF